jgi:hypothetical protein
VTEQPAISISINPGSGPVSEATERNAIDNVAAFTADLLTRGITVTGAVRRPAVDYGSGRYAFTVTTDDGRDTEIQMPGLPVDQVRWLKSEGQDIWQFPRMYVNDGSWIWYFALDQFDEGERRWPDGTVMGGEIITFSSTTLAGDDTCPGRTTT